MREDTIQLNWRDTLVRLFQDENGNFKMGTDNYVTPEKLIKAMKIEGYDKNDAYGREIYQRARIELCAFMAKLRKEGYYAGSFNRSPSMYFIAKNKTERRMILNKVAKNTIGRLRTCQTIGNGLLSPRKIGSVIKELDFFVPLEEATN